MKQLITCIRFFVLLMLLTGVLYPIGVTLLAGVLFPHQAKGSLVILNGKIVGSELLAQKTENPKYFWPRPSSGSYATIPSGASNLGPSSAALQKGISDFSTAFRKANKLSDSTPLPDDLITTSASGLDPHISPAAALIQIARVAAARGYTPVQMEKLKTLVESHVEKPQLGFLGDARVNVLLLNLDLGKL